MLRVIVENDRVKTLVEKEQESYLLESSRCGIGTIVLNKGAIIKHNWQDFDSFVKFAQSYVHDKEIDEMVDSDFSFVEVKFVYSYENYEKFLTDRGVTV
ncbi:hypothetical protein DIGNKC_248 [Bacillus phage DIGNKC]|uniref:hypothetical protein n=1 Tax=Bacillus phage DIGNKC TaxID=1805948 RepID=UPI0007A76DEF|nr:hypothetical protein BI007_gp126 [Bacillus phage DIGNKC]AMW62769.1 hypothetical protein DIGNKC_248 [Bacillus phage DIGNKC]AOZ61875.1 hypothetical protein BJ4_252 [Bacillus phage BJ4]AOZ62505.1 hypothetical protein SBP8a_255 [Bacillus phage SBP8a]